jgi:hypothetical protein
MTRASGSAPALLAILALGLALRVLVIVTLPAHEWFAGGDGPWYVRQGWLIARGALEQPLQTVGPVYPLALAGIWRAFPVHEDPDRPLAVSAFYLTVVRLLQAVIGIATAALAHALARQMRLGHRRSLVAALGVGLGPAFVIEPFLIHTETLFMMLFSAAVLLHVRAVAVPSPTRLVLAGALTALAALTRPVLLLFPAVLAIHPTILYGRPRAVRAAAAVLTGAVLTLAPWHVWLHRTTGSWLPAGPASNLWIGTQTAGGSLDVATFHELEKQLQASGRGYLGGALDVIASDPAGWVARRSRNVIAAIAQPHGTSDLGGPSTKAQLAAWLREDRSFGGLWHLASTPAFGVRLLAYLFHYAVLVLAAAGVWRTWRHWRDWYPIYAAVLYLTFVHAVLIANPRYLFPVQPFLWVMAAAGLANGDRIRPDGAAR